MRTPATIAVLIISADANALLIFVLPENVRAPRPISATPIHLVKGACGCLNAWTAPTPVADTIGVGIFSQGRKFF